MMKANLMTALARIGGLALGLCWACTCMCASAGAQELDAEDPALETEAEAEAAAANPTEPSAHEDSEPNLAFRAFAGVGVGQRTLNWSEAGELRRVATGVFPALDLGTSFHVSVNDVLSIGPELHYQTSIAGRVNEMHIDAPADTLRIRAHRFDAVLAAVFSFGQSGWRIVPALGYAVHALNPEVHHLLTPSYMLGGPVVRLTLRIPFGASVAVRIAPEAQWLIVSEELEQRGLAGTGFGVGGEMTLEIGLHHAWALELSARMARAQLSAIAAEPANDSAQFATARLVWQP